MHSSSGRWMGHRPHSISGGSGTPCERDFALLESQLSGVLQGVSTKRSGLLSVQQWIVDNWPDLNQSGVSFLLTDLDIAMTFMNVADASRIEETTRRNYTNARAAYDTVLRLLEKLTPTADEREAIDAKLASLKMRLQSVGQQF